MNINNTPTQTKKMSFEQMLKELRNKKKWLRTADRQLLLKRHGIHESTLSRMLNGHTKRLNFDLIADALEIICKHEHEILSRL